MNKQNYTVRSLLTRLQLQITDKRYFRRPILGSVFLFLISNTQAEVKVAIVDTGFCHNETVRYDSQKVLNSIDMTDSVKLNCQKIPLHIKNSSLRFHGQHVLQSFLKGAGSDRSIVVYPIILFDANGNQTEAAWLKAINFIAKEKIDIVIAASSLPTKKRISENLPGVWFVASGRTERGITTNDSLFPQLLAPVKNMIIIGDYFEGQGKIAPIYDQALLYQNEINYFFPSGEGQLKGTSSAVADAAGQAVNLCYGFLKTSTGVKDCLKKNSRILRDKILKKDIATFSKLSGRQE